MKDFLKHHVLVCAAAAFLLIFAVAGTISVLQSQTYEYRIDRSARNISLTSEGDPVVELTDIRTEEETILTLNSLKTGTGFMEVHYTLGSTRITQGNTVTVSKTGMIFVTGEIFDYGGFSTIYRGLTFYFGLMAVYFIWLRRVRQKETYYSFESIGFCGAAILFSTIFLIYFGVGLGALVLSYAQTAKLLIIITANLMLTYSVLTVPFVLVFALSLAASNVELIRHEGRHLSNMLGMGIALLLMGGAVVDLALFLLKLRLDTAGIFITYGIYSAGFTIFQVLLVASIITCLQAAYRKVPFDKDYIIILGCAIRKDGTLFPLIRGRVDRAIEFWHAQYEATGKRAVFVPSGGQGSDEILPEGRAMERYLLEQGIPRECIMAEDRSVNTRENMKFSKALIDGQKQNAAIVFSTTNYHVFRSGLLANQVGVPADGIGARTKWYFWPNAMIREVIGVFARQTKLQWAITFGLILLAGLASYGYTLI